MSLLIKDLAMPVFEGQSWTIHHGADGKWYVEDTNAETTDGKWHEIISIPAHGRLVDADELADSFEPSDFWNPDAEDNCFAAVRIVHSAPTIIEAEAGGE